jgi:tRNA(Ile)-lysidine synthase
MDIDVKPGKYIIAVSGGVDSMVLLDILADRPGLQLIVAHFEHGMRDDSDRDRQLVEQAAAHYKLPFVCEHGKLGAGASEATARQARYAFLRRIKAEAQTDAIVTAHHQDDLIETAIINILRGTGRKGLSSLQSSADIVRPLLRWTKRDIYDYAAQHPGITWHDDSTNQNDAYLRNYVRHHIINSLGEAGRAQLLERIQRAAATNPVIDDTLSHAINAHLSGGGDGKLDRRWFIMLPYDVSCEIMAAWFRMRGIREFDRRLIEQLVVATKVLTPGKRKDINAAYLLEVGKYGVEISHR